MNNEQTIIQEENIEEITDKKRRYKKIKSPFSIAVPLSDLQETDTIATLIPEAEVRKLTEEEEDDIILSKIIEKRRLKKEEEQAKNKLAENREAVGAFIMDKLTMIHSEIDDLKKRILDKERTMETLVEDMTDVKTADAEKLKKIEEKVSFHPVRQLLTKTVAKKVAKKVETDTDTDKSSDIGGRTKTDNIFKHLEDGDIISCSICSGIIWGGRYIQSSDSIILEHTSVQEIPSEYYKERNFPNASEPIILAGTMFLKPSKFLDGYLLQHRPNAYTKYPYTRLTVIRSGVIMK